MSRALRLIDGQIPFRLARDLKTCKLESDVVAVAAALYEFLPDSLEQQSQDTWRMAARIEAISRHPNYGKKQVQR